MRRALTFLGIAAFGLAAFGLGTLLIEPNRGGPPPASIVEQVRAELAASYYRPVRREILRLDTVESMIAALEDPYTEYLDPVSYRLLEQQTATSYSGIGVTVLPTRQGLSITAVGAGPARAAGVRAGDRIVAIDGSSLVGVAFEQALGRILGPEGSTLRLHLMRGGRAITVPVVRRRIAAPLVRARLLALPGRGVVGYVRLEAFRAGASQVLRAQLRRLERQQVSALVLDLRGNPGGLLDQAIAVASLFLDEGVVVSVESAHHHGEVYNALRTDATTLPLVVLVDRASASSAEVVAAALHDHDRAALVGENTYGKALVQTVTPLANGAALKLTTARYRTPAGIDISRQGVRPDVLAVDDPDTPADEALSAALAQLSR